MSLIATIEQPMLSVPAGGEVSCEVRVHNTGMVVDSVLLDVVGDAGAWATVDPPRLNLLPSAEGVARVTFRPPRLSSLPAGPVAYAVRAMSQEDPAGSVVEEGGVEVGAFREITAQLVPRTSEGKRVGKHRLTVENRGNVQAHVLLSATDPDDALEFTFEPEILTAEPGTATFVRVRVAPRKRFLKGPNKSLPFQAYVLPEETEPIALDGAMLQRQLLPTWLFKALVVAAAGCAALVALWFLVFKPEVHSAATDAVAKENRALKSNAAAASSAASSAQAAASNANAAAAAAGGGGPAGGAGNGSASPGASTSASTSGPAADGTGAGGAAGGGTPVSALVQSDVAPNSSGTVLYQLPKHFSTLAVSDFVAQNPNGDSGTLQILAGDTPKLTLALDDFRDYDKSFVQPLIFTADEPFTVAVTCANATDHCTAGVLLSGQLYK